MENIISALIAGGLALIGVIITNATSNKKIEQQLITSQAVTDTKLDSLTSEVRQHNDFARRVPVIENDVKQLKEDMKDLQKEVRTK